MRVNSRGLADFKNRIDDAVRRMESEIGGMLQDEAENLRDEIVSRAPVRSGELAGSVQVVETGPHSFIVEIDAPHALHVEYGTSKMEAQPFIRPAIDATRPSVLGRFEAWVASFFS